LRTLSILSERNQTQKAAFCGSIYMKCLLHLAQPMSPRGSQQVCTNAYCPLLCMLAPLLALDFPQENSFFWPPGVPEAALSQHCWKLGCNLSHGWRRSKSCCTLAPRFPGACRKSQLALYPLQAPSLPPDLPTPTGACIPPCLGSQLTLCSLPSGTGLTEAE
jgi:hypothetical protein